MGYLRELLEDISLRLMRSYLIIIKIKVYNMIQLRKVTL